MLILLMLTLVWASCGDTSTKTVDEATTTSSSLTTSAPLIIAGQSFAGISLGDAIADHKASIEAGIMRTGEGDFDIYEIHDDTHGVLGHFIPVGKEAMFVGDITVSSPAAQTKTGIKIGDTFGELLTAYPKLVVHGSEIESRTHAAYGNLLFRIDEAHNTYDLAIEAVSKAAKITEIVIVAR